MKLAIKPLFFLLISFVSLNAQQINIISWNSVRQLQNPCDTITAHIAGDMDATYAPGPINVSISGFTINVEIVKIYGFATQPVSPNIAWSENIELGYLAKGNYTLNVTTKLSTVTYDFKSFTFSINHMFTYLNDTSICYGDSVLLNGKVTGMKNPTYAWSNGKTTQNIYASSPSIYSLIASGSNCTVYDTMTLGVSAEIMTIIEGDSTVCSGDTFTLGGGPSYYSYKWNENSQADTAIFYFQNVGSELVWVKVTDSNLCTSKQEMNLIVEDCDTLSTGIIMDNESNFRLYPNPANDLILLENVKLKGNLVFISIHSIQGELIRDLDISDFTGKAVIDISKLTPGMYLVSVESMTKLVHFNLVLKR